MLIPHMGTVFNNSKFCEICFGQIDEFDEFSETIAVICIRQPLGDVKVFVWLCLLKYHHDIIKTILKSIILLWILNPI